MGFTTKKQSYPNHNKRFLASSIFISIVMPSKQSYFSNIHTSSSDPKHWPVSPGHTDTQGKQKSSTSLNSPNEIIKKKFISIMKAKKRANFSLPISPTEWSVLSEHVINSENDKRFQCSLSDNKSFANV